MPGTREFVAKARITLSICGSAVRSFATRSGSVKRAAGATLDCAATLATAVVESRAVTAARTTRDDEERRIRISAVGWVRLQ